MVLAVALRVGPLNHFQNLADLSFRIGTFSKKNSNYFPEFFPPNLIFHKTVLGHVRSHKMFGSAVLTFIGYKQTDK